MTTTTYTYQYDNSTAGGEGTHGGIGFAHVGWTPGLGIHGWEQGRWLQASVPAISGTITSLTIQMEFVFCSDTYLIEYPNFTGETLNYDMLKSFRVACWDPVTHPFPGDPESGPYLFDSLEISAQYVPQSYDYWHTVHNPGPGYDFEAYGYMSTQFPSLHFEKRVEDPAILAAMQAGTTTWYFCAGVNYFWRSSVAPFSHPQLMPVTVGGYTTSSGAYFPSGLGLFLENCHGTIYFIVNT